MKLKNKTILFIEDNDSFREGITEFLKMHQINVIKAKKQRRNIRNIL